MDGPRLRSKAPGMHVERDAADTHALRITGYGPACEIACFKATVQDQVAHANVDLQAGKTARDRTVRVADENGVYADVARAGSGDGQSWSAGAGNIAAIGQVRSVEQPLIRERRSSTCGNREVGARPGTHQNVGWRRGEDGGRGPVC